MAVHHGKEGEVTVGGSAVGELTSFTLETTGDVVESTQMSDGAKSFIAGRTSFSGTLEMHFDEADSVQTQLTAGSSVTFKLLPEVLFLTFTSLLSGILAFSDFNLSVRVDFNFLVNFLESRGKSNDS